jgi:hypothetical protein
MKSFLQKLWRQLSQARRRAVRPTARVFRANVEVLEIRETPSVDLMGIASAVCHSAEHYGRNVSNVYQSDLFRSADVNEQSGWAAAMQNGVTEQQFETAVLSSAEYYAKHGSSPASWVGALYTDVLHRSGSTAEKQYWVGLLNTGASYSTVASSIDTSFEANCVRAQTMYTNILHRTPGTAEVVGWANVYGSGVDVNTVLASFIASAEYRGGFTSNGAWLTEGYMDALGRYPTRTSNEIRGWLGSDTGWEPMKWAVGRPGESRDASDSDVVQGGYGTCFLAASLAASAQAGRDLTSTTRIQYAGHNHFWVRLYDPTTLSSDWRWITYNGTVLGTDYQPVGSDGSDFWPLLYQRAYLDHYPSAISNGGFAFTALKVVDGKANVSVVDVGVGNFTDSDFWKLFNATPATSTHQAVVADAFFATHGIVASHSYQVVNVNYLSGYSGHTGWYVDLRNPWGNDMRSSDWNSTYSWALDSVHHDGMNNNNNDGFLRVSWDTFVSAFGRYEIN